MDQAIHIVGKSPWQFCRFDALGNATSAEIKTFVVASMIAKGVLMGTSLNLCYAHDDADLETVAEAFDRTFSELADEAPLPGMADRLGGALIQPVFSPR